MTTVLPITVSTTECIEKESIEYIIKKYIVYVTSMLLTMVLIAGIVVFCYYMYTMNAPTDDPWISSNCTLTSIVSIFNYTCENKDCVACSYKVGSSHPLGSVGESITYNIQGKVCHDLGVYPCFYNKNTNHISSTNIQDRKAIDMVLVQFAITTIVIFGGILGAIIISLIYIILQHLFKLV
jgi:hypothetical protein